ncbi:hypothetical protein BpHYR1_011078 [Brachionus plicatilis]|uniref:Uncharacterized protein n=1 Tax=Brachionus plicatilis TaxID=10195 RepID=A0A3M7RYB7_BRAPC|nr:hypothetical protein BpHYR1_011078 [Brachionus plicatilis]
MNIILKKLNFRLQIRKQSIQKLNNKIFDNNKKHKFRVTSLKNYRIFRIFQKEVTKTTCFCFIRIFRVKLKKTKKSSDFIHKLNNDNH